MWTYGLMALNVLTGHWPNIYLNATPGWTWDGQARPILMKALQEPFFNLLLRKALPCAKLSGEETTDALHFVLSLMRLGPAERPTAKLAANHQFLRGDAVHSGFGDFRPPVSQVVMENAHGHFEGAFAASAYNPSSVETSTEVNATATEVSATVVNQSNRQGLGKRIKRWFVKKYRRIRPKKNDYVILSSA